MADVVEAWKWLPRGDIDDLRFDALEMGLPMPRRLEYVSMNSVVDDEHSSRHGASISLVGDEEIVTAPCHEILCAG